MKNISLALSLIFLIISNLPAQESIVSYEKLLSPAELKEDLALLKYNLETVHAGLYLYNSKEIIDAQFAKIENELTEPMNQLAFRRKLCTLNKIIGNGHTGFNVSDDYHHATQKDLLRFPFDIYRDNNEIYVTRNMSDNKDVEAGWKIRSINDRNANEIFQELADARGRDGQNETGPEAYVNTRFSIAYAFYYGTPDTYEMEFVDKAGKINLITIKGLSLDKIRANRKLRYDLNLQPWYSQGLPGLSLEMKGNKTAVLTIRTFSASLIKKTGEKTEKFFQAAFEEIEASGIEHLIIDMRGNGGGGPDVSNALFSHLLDKPFTFYDAVYADVRKIPNPKMYTEGAKMINLLGGVLLKENDEGTFDLKTEGLKPEKPVWPVYQKKLYVLTDGKSFSQTGEAAGFFKSETNALFIGEECGGSPIQNTSGVGLPLELPNSKNVVTIPLILWKMNVNFENTGRGVIPDHIVKPSIEDVLSKRDAVMEFTINLIEKNQGVN